MPCDRKIGPYDCCSVVQGDCLELMKAIPFEIFRCECGEDVSGEGGVFHIAAGHKMKHGPAIDAVISDPPYGINYVHGGNDSDSNPTKFAGIAVIGDDRPFDPSPWLNFPKLVLWGGNHYAERLPSSAGWLVWDKRQGTVVNDHSDCELAWTNCINSARVFYQIWDGFRRGSETGIPRVHPTQKPICLMEWCIEKAGMPETILDPYCGSGTTLVAAKKLGRHFLGFEISEEYCKIARDRIARVEAQPTLFETKAEQLKFESGDMK